MGLKSEYHPYEAEYSLPSVDQSVHLQRSQDWSLDYKLSKLCINETILIKRKLKRRDDCNIYLTYVCRHRPLKR